MAKKPTKSQLRAKRITQQQTTKLQKEYERSKREGLGLTTSSTKGRKIKRQEPFRRQTKSYPSLETGIGDCTKQDSLKYTGDKLIGIGMMHKSNLVPIFNDQEAKDISKMRRN
jgi:hypothetical protein